MAGFIYFVPGSHPLPTLDLVRSWGLAHALDGDGAISSREVNANSPSGQPGRVLGVEVRLAGKTLGVFPDQAWRKLPQLDAWVGYWRDAKPMPDDLARVKQIAGPTVEMADGNRWMVPLVLSLDVEAGRYEPGLPTRWDFNDDGEWVRGSIAEEHRALWDAAVPFADQRFEMTGADDAAPQVVMTNKRLLDTVVLLLSANYVVGQAELAMLGALANDDATGLVPLLACDFFTLAEWAESQKKSESRPEKSGGDTVDGEAA